MSVLLYGLLNLNFFHVAFDRIAVQDKIFGVFLLKRFVALYLFICVFLSGTMSISHLVK